MRERVLVLVVLLALLGSGTFTAAGAVMSEPRSVAPQGVPTGTQTISLSVLGRYTTNVFNEGAAEIVAHDPQTQRLFVVNGSTGSIDILDLRNPATPTLVSTIVLSPTYGVAANSVDVANGIVAVAVEAANPIEPGKAVFFDANGTFLSQATVGVLPDMITFTPDNRRVLTANEGEPTAYPATAATDPEGSVSVVSLPNGGPDALRGATLTSTNVSFSEFNVGGPRAAELPAGVRVFGPGASVAQDLEPEYIAVSPDSATAYVTLQENNALAVVDIAAGRVTTIKPLGSKDHSLAGNGLDASDRDGPNSTAAINVIPQPVRGLYMPDAIDAYQANGQTFLVTANEGDAREYDGYPNGREDRRVSQLTLDPSIAGLAASLGRLRVSDVNADTDGDGDIDVLYPLGARSFTIWGADGALVYDSGDDIEQRTAAAYPANFNASNDDNALDSRSPAKGPEPEGLETATLAGRAYAFVGLERIGGVMVYDVTTPNAPTFVQYVNNRDFAGDPEQGTAGDGGPEGLTFVSADDSPNGQPLLLVANEVSGSVTVYGVALAQANDGAGRLSLLHNNDGESSLLPIRYSARSGGSNVSYDAGGIAAFSSVTDREIADARAANNAVVNLYAGDAFLASATLSCSLPPNATTPVYDAVAQRQLPYTAHIIGNHEFDYGPDFLKRFIDTFGGTQPFLSANLDFAGEPSYATLLDSNRVILPPITDGRVIGGSMIYTDTVTGQRFGIVGLTTPELPTISSPRNVVVTSSDITTTTQVAQATIDQLYNAYGVRKIIFASHLQNAQNDRALIARLTKIDLAVAGGGDELLTSTAVPTSTQLLPGEQSPIVGTYPLVQKDADNRDVYIVTTAGNYKYLGRLDVVFNAAGEVASVVAEESYPRRVAPVSTPATTLGVTDAVAPDPTLVSSVVTPVQACLETFKNTPVVQSEVVLDVSRAGVRGRETNAGNLIADSFLYAYDRYAARVGLPARSASNPVIAVQNGGGIRQNAGDTLPASGAPGVVSRLDTLNVLAFENNLTVVSNVTPPDVKEILERSVSIIGGGQFLQVAGITVTYNLSNAPQVVQTNGTITAPGSRIVDVTLNDGTPIIRGGQVVSGAPNVRLVTNGFTADGGDNYPTLARNSNQVNLRDTTDALISYEQAWREYLGSFPVQNGVPTISANDARYRPGGVGRLTALRVLFLPVVSAQT